MPYLQSLSLLIHLLLFTAYVQCQTCFYPNGNAVPDQGGFNATKPCNIDPVRTICCSVNRPIPPGGNLNLGAVQDICLSNGLCEYNITTNDGLNLASYFLGQCTDPDPTKGNCLDVCRATRDSNFLARITPCDGTRNSTRWCCGVTLSCCANDTEAIELPHLFNGHTLRAVPSSMSSSMTSGGSSSASSSTLSALTTPIASPPPTGTSAQPPTQTPTSPSPTSGRGTTHGASVSVGAAAGIGLGAAVFTIAIVVIAIFIAIFIRRSQTRGKKARVAQFMGLTNIPSTSASEHDTAYAYRNGGWGASELPSERVEPQELASKKLRAELPGHEAVIK